MGLFSGAGDFISDAASGFDDIVQGGVEGVVGAVTDPVGTVEGLFDDPLETVLGATGAQGVAEGVNEFIKNNPKTTLLLGGTAGVTTFVTSEIIKDPTGFLADTEDFFVDDLPALAEGLLEDFGFVDPTIADDRAALIAANAEAARQREIASRFDRARTELTLKRERSRLARQQRIGVAGVQQAAQATGTTGGSSALGAAASIRATESAEQAFITSQRAGALGAGTARGAAITQENLAGQLQADITFKQQEVANTRALFGQGAGLATSIAGLF